MGKHKFSTAQRVALWQAYNKRCAISGEPLSFEQLHIDHILPEKLLNNSEELEHLKANYGLKENFDINGYYNWLPVRSRINLQKGGLIYSESNARYYLEIAQRHYGKVLKYEQRFNKYIAKEELLLPLKAAIEIGIFSSQEAIKYLEGLSNDEQFYLLNELHFNERIISGYINHSYFDDLVELSVDFGASIEEGLELVNNTKETVCIKTCQEFFEAKKLGFYALTTYAMKVESKFNQTCGIVESFSKARVPQESYISNSRIGLVDLNFLPISILASLSSSPEDNEEKIIAIASGKSVQDWVDEGLVKIKKVTQHSIHIEHNQMGQILSELLRADFNNDGVEDVLIFSYAYAIKGSFGYGNVLTITRHHINEKLFTLL